MSYGNEGGRRRNKYLNEEMDDDLKRGDQLPQQQTARQLLGGFGPVREELLARRSARGSDRGGHLHQLHRCTHAGGGAPRCKGAVSS